MIVFRITTRKYASNLSGIGAAIYPGRWNKANTPVLYTGESKEIALLETIAHVSPMLVPDLSLLTLLIPDDSISEIELKNLPKNWAAYPAPTILSEIGEKWIQENNTIALKVPSCIIHSSHNFILNCSHPDYNKVKLLSLEDFNFDKRLLK